jgi:hypothetical protein
LGDAFSATFSERGIAFDKSTGAFVSSGREKGVIALHGDGTPAMWTYRALERSGYRVLPGGTAGISIQVLSESGRPVWRLCSEKERLCSSIEDMLVALNERHRIEQKENYCG